MPFGNRYLVLMCLFCVFNHHLDQKPNNESSQFQAGNAVGFKIVVVPTSTFSDKFSQKYIYQHIYFLQNDLFKNILNIAV